MKIIRIGPDAVFHRHLTPKWAFLPTSGAGAVVDGGRFNRPGVEALYLSVAPQTALNEYRQGASIAPLATLAAYKIALSEVADLSEGFDPLLGMLPGLNGIAHGGKLLALTKKVPPSWKLADKVISAGLRGLLFPSLRHAGGTSLVIFPANLIADDDVHVHDPDNRLPRDQSSCLHYQQ